MKKPNQALQQNQQGGAAMNESQLYFVTFPTKVNKEKAKEVITELRRRFPSKTAIFTPKPPAGRRILMTINGILVIITFPYPNKQATKQEEAFNQEGFTLGELIKSKKT